MRKVQASHLTCQILYGLSPNPYTTERDNKSVRSQNVISFLLGDMFAMQTRYTRFARAIYCRFAPMRYDINPLTLLTYLACGEECKSISQGVALYRVLNISPVARCSKHIANPARDLYRCVFSVKDNTLKSRSVLLFLSQNVLYVCSKIRFLFARVYDILWAKGLPFA